MAIVTKGFLNGRVDLPYISQPTLVVTRGEDVTINGYIEDTDLTAYTVMTNILTRDITVTGFTFNVSLAPNQDLPENKGKFTLTLSRNISKELKHNEYFCYVYILSPDNKLSIPEDLKIKLIMVDNISPDMIP